MYNPSNRNPLNNRDSNPAAPTATAQTSAEEIYRRLCKILIIPIFILLVLNVFILLNETGVAPVITAIANHVVIADEGYEIDNFGTDFQEFVANTRDLPYEVWGSFTPKGKKVVDFCGESDTKVSIPGVVCSYGYARGGRVYAHTHLRDAAFSLADLAHNNDNIKAEIVISPSFTYFVAPGERGWPSMVELEAVLAYATATGGPVYPRLHLTADGHLGYVMTDALMEMIARQCDLHYYRLDGNIWPDELIKAYT